MVGGADHRRGELRMTLEGLLRTCVELERRADDAGHEARKEVNDVARTLVDIRVPGLNDLTDQILAIGGQMETDVIRALSDGRRPYLAEVHELLGLLAPYHGVNVALGPLRPTVIAVRDVDAFANQFPAGFARTYIRDLIASVDGSITLTIDEAGRIHVVPSDVAATTKEDTRPGFSDAHRDTGVRLLKHVECHAIEQHGPQIPDQAQLARLLWLKDPSGKYPWRVDADGKVVTTHWAGTTTGGFTSPEAMAKPIDTLLATAHRNHGSLDEFLDAKFEVERVMIHVDTDEAGLEIGDIAGYQGAGTGTKETRSDWKAARKFAMRDGRHPVHAIPYDPLASGSNPGANLILKKTLTTDEKEPTWHLVTCYPVDEQRPESFALEELRDDA